ncbi:epidermal growth factor-like protein 7 [Carcharodon carcharias]|uniref:epidermal growth factor-like protein 7 n=1 Tax=Carcharodon carcharias TaxID=13397 RepID=UPI001B7E961D|nr:epidermal growth factor-like protein 7 [Carcharodon carcharias]
MRTLCLALGLVLGSIISAGSQRAQGGRHVCSVQTMRVPLVYTETFIQPVYKPYITMCEGYRVCSTYRTTYKTASREVRREILQTVYECCPGWRKKQAHVSNCELAICDKPCQNGGSCSYPDTCTCHPGWTGRTCAIDVDECHTRLPLCSQRCANTLGSYRCQCLVGYTLMADGRSCRKSPMTTSWPVMSPSPLPPDTTEIGSDGIGNEVQEFRSRLELLEQKMQWTLSTFEHLMLTTSDKMHLDDPMSLENTQNLISHFQQLDRIDSLSEQIAFLEERLDFCSCKDRN